MPTTKALLFFSWALAVLGAALAAYSIFSRGINTPTLIKAVFSIFAGLISATALRTFANIGQLVFDLNQNQCDGFSALIRHHQDVVRNHQDIAKNHQGVVEEFQALKNVVEQLGCDLKDVNQNIQQMNRNIQEMSQDSHQVAQDTRQVAQDTHQVNEFFLKMKCHIETQQ
ncbi:MAG: hypothetical protein WCJ71_03150 [Candidatus Omnitrophota bacterium]